MNMPKIKVGLKLEAPGGHGGNPACWLVARHGALLRLATSRSGYEAVERIGSGDGGGYGRQYV